MTLCVIGYAQSNGRQTDAPGAGQDVGAAEATGGAPPAAQPAASTGSILPDCPRLDVDDAGVQAALAAYCKAVLAAHRAAVHAAVTAAAAAVERDVAPKLAAARADAEAARAAHRGCTIEGAILGAAVAVGAHLLHDAVP